MGAIFGAPNGGSGPTNIAGAIGAGFRNYAWLSARSYGDSGVYLWYSPDTEYAEDRTLRRSAQPLFRQHHRFWCFNGCSHRGKHVEYSDC